VKVRTSLAAVLMVLGFMVLTSATATRAARRNAEPRRSQLVTLIRSRQREVGQLSDRLVRLRAQASRAQRSLLRRENVSSARVKREQLLAGLTDVKGGGIEVVLRDSDRSARDLTVRDALRIRDTDMQRVVNALWAAGAEAVAVNGQRVVATTAIRIAGDTITVNFRPLAAPFRVLAIGVDQKRFERSAVAREFRRWVDAYGLGFSVHKKSDVRVPAFTGRVAPAVAEPVGGPS
jgi:uncharacterized protein YlxW (UPF0749 family)